MKKFLKNAGISLLVISVLWIVLTFWAEAEGPALNYTFSNTGPKRALVVFDPDPIYNLDEQVCIEFAKTLALNGMAARAVSVAALANDTGNYDLYVLCANTYNWRPDWALTGYIEKTDLAGKDVIAITLGSGSTVAAKNAFEKILLKRGARVLDSRSFWLMRPNNESRINEPNVEVCLSMVQAWAKEVSAKYK